MAVASFDIFDTLITRDYAHPVDLFVALGRTLAAQSMWTGSAADFAALRVEVERSARRASASRETDLDAIYRGLASAASWGAEDARTASLVEVELERASWRIIPAGKQAVERARGEGRRVCFLSDMYLPSGPVREWLAANGIFREGDEILISGEHACGKGTGGLYRLAAKKHQDGFADWIHLGDNYSSDFKAASPLGIKAVWTQPALPSRRVECLRGDGQFAPEWRSRLAAAARLARLDADSGLAPREREIWNTASEVAGPLFWSFTRWYLSEAKRMGVEDLHFLSRGGQIFWKIAGGLEEGRALKLHYLYTSRIAYLGAFEVDSSARIRQLAAPTLAFHSPRQALANLGVQASEIRLPDRWLLRIDQNLVAEERSALADWLLEPEQLKVVQGALSRRAALAGEYVRESGLSAERRAGLVDTGWMGTIQRNIEWMLFGSRKCESLHGFYLGLSTFREFAVGNNYHGYTNQFGRLSLRRETTHLILLEIFASATHGPLVGFERTDGKVAPVLGATHEDAVRDTQLIHDGIMAFVARAEESGLRPDHHADVAAVTLGNYLDFFHHPTRQEALSIGSIHHSDQMLESSFSGLCQPMDLGKVLRSIRNFYKRPPGWWLSGQAALGHRPILVAYIWIKKIKWWIQTAVTGALD